MMSQHNPVNAQLRHASTSARSTHRGVIGGTRASVLLDGAATGGRFALLKLLEARGAEPPRHLHHWEDETLYVLRGTITVSVGDATLPAPAGTAVLLPRGIEHGYAVVTPSASLLVYFAPAGFEDYFRAMEAEALTPTTALERLICTAARFGCEITGPPPSNAGRSPPL